MPYSGSIKENTDASFELIFRCIFPSVVAYYYRFSVIHVIDHYQHQSVPTARFPVTLSNHPSSLVIVLDKSLHRADVSKFLPIGQHRCVNV